MAESNVGSQESSINKKKWEIFRFPKVTAIASRTFADQHAVNSLLTLTQDGIPPSWVPISVDQTHLLQDSVVDPQWVAKIREFASPAQFKEDIEDEWFFEDKKLVYARNSLLSQFDLAPEIRAVLQTDAVQSLADEHHIDTISLVEPLLGLIEQDSTKKVMVYPWISGYTYDPSGKKLYTHQHQIEENPNNPLVKLADSDFIQRLTDEFKNNGIAPVDLGIIQVIADVKDNGIASLHLVDVEEYFRISNKPKEEQS